MDIYLYLTSTASTAKIHNKLFQNSDKVFG